ncbi:MAG: YiiX/YebB-like N1pC/P60 family cysteine hydrolase [Dehalococcoidia bacterium]|nr:YiiX/YebB-like N1pC/P60 family cysteine hydrolase [Dehalococcoidia bacterium]
MERSAVRRIGVCLVLLFVAVSLVVVRGSTLPVPARVGEIDEEFLEAGDLLFVDIYNGWSEGGYWDHVAVYVEDPYPSVVEATYNLGISQTALGEFLARDLPAEVSVRRLKDVHDRDKILGAVVEYALAQTGRPFDYAATATFPVKLNSGNLHCAELGWRAYMAAGIDLDSNGGFLVFPDDIYFSPKLGRP